MSEVKHRGSKDTAEHYKGIPVHAAPGVHQKVADIIRSKVPNGSRVADVGAGDGALSLRLHDLGFKVSPFDVDDSTWEVRELVCNVINVENSFSEINRHGPYAALCAIEIIEHLENPRAFLKDMVQIARTYGAILVISTPNPLDTFSSISHFTRGFFNWFSPAHYLGGGHISILPHWMITQHLKYLGVEKFEWQFCAPYRHPSTIKRFFYSCISQFRRMVSKSDDKSFFDGQTALVTIYP